MLKPWAMAALLGAVFLLPACQTAKSRHACQQDVRRLKAAIAETGAYFEALEPVLRDAHLAQDACKNRTQTCGADYWLGQLARVQAQQDEVEARFARAVEVFEPDACLRYSAEYRLNPPDPETYKGYFSAYDQAEDEIDGLIRHFSVFEAQ